MDGTQLDHKAETVQATSGCLLKLPNSWSLSLSLFEELVLLISKRVDYCTYHLVFVNQTERV